jgi:hypothetical protein
MGPHDHPNKLLTAGEENFNIIAVSPHEHAQESINMRPWYALLSARPVVREDPARSRSRQIHLICAPQLLGALGLPAAPIGGYLRTRR